MALLIALKARKPETANTYGLPRGEPIRREQVRIFAAQRKAVLRWLRTGKKDLGDPLPRAWPDWHDFGLGAIDNAYRMTPLLTLVWEQAAAKFAPRVGLDPNVWEVVNPNTEKAIEDAALAFCEATNDTTSLDLDVALQKTRQELTEGIVKKGESLDKLTKRVNAIFDKAEKWRARRIAQTETSRAVHAAQEVAAIDSGVVTGWTWLLSSDACPLCNTIARRAPAVKLGQPFAVIGTDPHYRTIKFPPAHPHCNCTVLEVLDTDVQPEFRPTLDQPEPESEDIDEPNVQPLRPIEAPLKPKPPKRKPRRPKSFQAEADARLTKAKDAIERHVVLNELIDKWAKPGGTGKAHGMKDPENFSKIEYGGIEWLFAEGRKEAVNDSIRTLWEHRKSIPDRLLQATRAVRFSSQDNVHDDYWRARYKDFTYSAATGGDGEIVVYRQGNLMIRELTHESGHNLANELYRSTSPPKTSDYGKLLDGDEKPVSEYAKNSPAEDFAEACRAYVQTQSGMKLDHPKRYAVIDKIMKDPSYGG